MSYADITFGDEYFSKKLNSEPWDDASVALKTKALEEGTLIIDRLNYAGYRADATQENQFPRGTDTEAPIDIKRADCEIALALLDGVNTEIEFENLKMTSHRYGDVKTDYDVSSPPPHIIAGVPSIFAWRYLVPYLRDDRFVQLNRIS